MRLIYAVQTTVRTPTETVSYNNKPVLKRLPIRPTSGRVNQIVRKFECFQSKEETAVSNMIKKFESMGFSQS